jgi:hypothetical protein
MRYYHNSHTDRIRRLFTAPGALVPFAQIRAAIPEAISTRYLRDCLFCLQKRGHLTHQSGPDIWISTPALHAWVAACDRLDERRAQAQAPVASAGMSRKARAWRLLRHLMRIRLPEVELRTCRGEEELAPQP